MKIKSKMNLRLIQEIKASMLEDRLSENRQTWAKYLVEKQVDIQSLLPLLHEEYPTGINFSWLLGDIVVLKPECVLPIVPYCFELRDKMPFPGFKRSVAKMLSLTGVPD